MVTKTFLLQTLAEWGITSALVAFAKNDSKNIQELIARVLNAVCKFPELRGFVVQQGGSKALVGLALEGTDKGKRHAAQALARIGITQDPSIAFPGQRVRIFYSFLRMLIICPLGGAVNSVAMLYFMF